MQSLHNSSSQNIRDKTWATFAAVFSVCLRTMHRVYIFSCVYDPCWEKDQSKFYRMNTWYSARVEWKVRWRWLASLFWSRRCYTVSLPCKTKQQLIHVPSSAWTLWLQHTLARTHSTSAYTLTQPDTLAWPYCATPGRNSTFHIAFSWAILRCVWMKRPAHNIFCRNGTIGRDGQTLCPSF